MTSERKLLIEMKKVIAGRQILKREVCDEHLEMAQKEFPYIARRKAGEENRGQAVFSEAFHENKEGYDTAYVRGRSSLIVQDMNGLRSLDDKEINVPILNGSANYWRLLEVQVLITQNYLLTIPPNRPTDEKELEL
jgi:hypothetical protein